MRYNGLRLIIDMAVLHNRHEMVKAQRDALVLGALREDVGYLPLFGIVYEHLSITHYSGRWLPGGYVPLFSPGAAFRARHFFARAERAHRGGRHTAAFVQLGRASHLLIDMACPVHAHRVAHFTDPFEWYVEGNADRLAQLTIPPVPNYRSVGALVTGLARYTRAFAPDRSNHLWGRWLKRRGWRRSLKRDRMAEQARHIIPMAAGHLSAMLDMFVIRLDN